MYVFQSVSQSLISLPMGHFWGWTSETSGLVLIYLTLTEIFIVMMPFMLCLFINPPVRVFHKNTKLHIRTCPLYKRMDWSPWRVENMSKYIYQEQIRQILIWSKGDSVETNIDAIILKCLYCQIVVKSVSLNWIKAR